VLAGSTVKAAMLVAAGPAAAGVISANAAALTEGVLRTMFMTKVKTVLAGFLAVGVIGSGAGLITYHGLAAGPEKPQREAAEKPSARGADVPGERDYCDAASEQQGIVLVVGTEI